jgi:GMP synthase (glutamine-hydrolysing)
MMFFVCWMGILAVNAGHTFSNAVTMRKVTVTEKNDRTDAVATRKMKTKMLCQTTDPEEKRSIIGDTFMNVSFIICLEGENSKLNIA